MLLVAAGVWRKLQLLERMTKPHVAIQSILSADKLLQLRLSCTARTFGYCRFFSSVYGIFGCLQPCKPCIAVLYSQRRAPARSCIASLNICLAGIIGLQLPQLPLNLICLLLGRRDAEFQPLYLFHITGDICGSVVCKDTTPRDDKAHINPKG